METDLFGVPAPAPAPVQCGIEFPKSLTEKYRPHRLEDVCGLDKPKNLARRLIANPKESAFLFSGPSGVGKTSLALLLAELIPAELHHVPSQEGNLQNIERVRFSCQYYPASGFRCHLALFDEIDLLSRPAQASLLSKLDATNFFPNTIVIGTSNLSPAQLKEQLEPRFVSRFQVIEFSSYGMAAPAVELLKTVWTAESAPDAPAPNFARLVKESNNNVRESLMRLETEIMCS